jgi:hypothetical protein
MPARPGLQNTWTARHVGQLGGAGVGHDGGHGHVDPSRRVLAGLRIRVPRESVRATGWGHVGRQSTVAVVA